MLVLLFQAKASAAYVKACLLLLHLSPLELYVMGVFGHGNFM